MRRVALATLWGVLAACGGEQGGGRPGAIDERDAVVSGWRTAGLEVSALTVDKSGAIGPDCRTGTVGGVDVALCRFPDAPAAKAAEAKALAWVGEATGLALTEGVIVVAAVDRRGVDPTGRTLNALSRVVRPRAKR